MQELIKLATTQGIWALLSCILIIYILNKQEERDLKQEKREENYQKVIQELMEKLKAIDYVSSELKKIDIKIDKLSSD